MALPARKTSTTIKPADLAAPALSMAVRSENTSPWRDHDVQSFYGRVAVRETHGHGLPLVLLHGNSSSKDAFRRQMDSALGAHYRMVAIDLPGHGASDDAGDPQSGYTISGYADAVIDTIERLGLDRFALLGWSLGGHVAMEVAASAPGVLGLMVVGAPPFGTTAETVIPAFLPGPLAALVGKPTLDEAEMAVFAEQSGMAGHPELIDALRRADGRARTRVFEDAVMGGALDEREIVADLAVPVAMVLGANDPVVNQVYAQGLPYGSLWDGKFQIFPRTGHAPFLDAPELFNAMLGRFLADVERRAETQPATPGLSLGG